MAAASPKRAYTLHDRLFNEPVAATLSALMQPDELSTAELKLRVLEVLVKSSLTEADKLFLINSTLLPITWSVVT